MGKTQLKREQEYLESLSNFPTRLTIDGNCIENLIEGFGIVNITGRDILTREANIEGGGVSSSFIKINNYKGRTIEVEFLLEAIDNIDLMRKSEKLNAYLFTREDVDIFFNDDKYIYKGQVARIEATERTDRAVVGVIEIFCSDWKKYGENVRIESFEIMNYDLLHAIEPELIEMVVTTNTDRIKITNRSTGDYIAFLGQFKEGDIIKVYPKEQKAQKGTQNLLKYLDLRSNLEGFNLSYGDTLIKDNCSVNIEFREVRF